ncbi:MAG: hypothetical protein ABI528_03435 [bacterium]
MRKVSILCLMIMILISINTVNSASNIKRIDPNPVKLILCWEWNYMKVVCQSIDSTLTDENFAYSNAGINTMIISTDAAFGNLPPNERPILVIPNGSFLSGVHFAKLYPRVNIMMCYLSGSRMNSSFNPIDSIPSNLMFIAGGNELNDWTTGSGFDFIDSSDIQYVESDLSPRNQYRITNIVKKSDGTVKIYNPIIPAQTKVGWYVWLNINTFVRATKKIRANVVAINTDSGYIVVNNVKRISDNSTIGSIKVHWLSGSVTSAAAKISQIMKGRQCSFYEAKLCARMTASNSGVRDDTNGYGHLNVQAAINYELDASHKKEVEN